MAKDKDRVKCQYCDKEYSPKGVASHERACSENPDNVIEEKEVKEVKTKSKEQDIRLGYGDVSDKPLKQQIQVAQKRQRQLAQYYKGQEKKIVQISPMYRAHFGNSMVISLNGIPIYVPCDNKQYEIPKSYAMEVKSRVRKVDDQIKREARMSNVKRNFDGQRLGSLDLVKQV
jgi:hypothetical protein